MAAGRNSVVRSLSHCAHAALSFYLFAVRYFAYCIFYFLRNMPGEASGSRVS